MVKWDECLREILMCSFIQSIVLHRIIQRDDPFLTPSTYFLLFTIIPPNLIQLLKNEIFEESAEISWREKRSKADPPPTKHKSYWGFFFFLLWKWYCIVWMLEVILAFSYFSCSSFLLAFVNRYSKTEEEKKNIFR